MSQDSIKKVNILSPSLFSLHDEGSPDEQKTSLVKILGDQKGLDKDSFMDMLTELTGVADTVDEAAQKASRESEGTLMNVKGEEINISRENLTKIYGEDNFRKMKVLEKLHGMYTEEQKRMKDIVGSPILFSAIIASPATASQALIASSVLFTPLVLSPAIYGSVILSPWALQKIIKILQIGIDITVEVSIWKHIWEVLSRSKAQKSQKKEALENGSNISRGIAYFE
ncbi:Protein CBG24008 [Caenorhabditis briggsae]|uniref:Protein CBG24008 n=1 Tax=Caenorhabditis briggsae TaxID=6238 RepID=A8WJS5_CAEBR|nr:Protein CBG24008 [Caenorhabditis briggsae]CAP20718.1 Protein CBG24008 [Caenorhabditis briggsae]